MFTSCGGGVNVHLADDFAGLGGVQYGYELREGVLPLLPLCAHDSHRHLDGNAAQFVLNIVLRKET